MLKARLDALRRDDDDNIPPPPPPPTFFPPPSPPLPPPPTNFPPPANYPGPNLPPPGLPPDLFQPMPPPRPSFPPTHFRLPTNNNQLPTVGNVTKFGEIEVVKGEQELPRTKIKNEINELMKKHSFTTAS